LELEFHAVVVGMIWRRRRDRERSAMVFKEGFLVVTMLDLYEVMMEGIVLVSLVKEVCVDDDR
jgi:hypothetical protein